MADDLSQLDELIESDVLEALGVPVPEELQKNNQSGEEDNNIDSAIDFGDDIGVELTEPLEIEEATIPDILDDVVDEDIVDQGTEIVEDLDDIEILPFADDNIDEQDSQIDEAVQNDNNENSTDTITMTSNDIGSLADILSKLLNNKTIEITIKVKDS